MKKGRFMVELVRVFKAVGLLLRDISRPNTPTESHDDITSMDLHSQSWEIHQVETRRSKGLELIAN